MPSDRLTVEFDATDAIENIRAYEFSTKRKVRKLLATTGIDVQRFTKANTPVDTGRLRSSYILIFKNDGLGVEVSTNVQYAPFVEFGTQKMAAQPHLFPAYEQERPAFIRKLKAILGEPA